MDKIINFNEAKKKVMAEAPLPRPAFPTREEAECLSSAVDSYREAFPESALPYWLYDGRELERLWVEYILPLAEDENMNPWDIAGILFATTHGMDFVYNDGRPVKVAYNPKQEV